MNSQHEAILLRFPKYRESVIREIQENEEFEGLRGDYALCIEMLKSLEKDEQTKRAAFEEYLETKIELEQELLRYLFK